MEYYIFQAMLNNPADRAKIAASFAEYMRHDPAADRRQIGQELGAILARRAYISAEAQALGTEKENAAYIAALDAAFCSLCRALGAEGLTLTGGEISALKRQGAPAQLAAELDALHRVTIPRAERLGAEDAAALYYGLARLGLISGPLSAFAYYLGKLPVRREKGPEKPLSWRGTDALFSYFAWRLSMYTQRAAQGYTIREKALCQAFGIDERKRRSTIRPYLSALRQEETRQAPKGSETIDELFNTL